MFQLQSFASYRLLYTTKTNLVLSSDQVVVGSVKVSPWAFSSEGWTDPAVSASPCISCVLASEHLRVLWRICSSVPILFLHWGAPNWAQFSRCCPTKAKQRGRNASLHLLAVLILILLHIITICLSSWPVVFISVKWLQWRNGIVGHFWGHLGG